MNDKTVNMNALYAARNRLFQWQPTALYVRLEHDKCPSCGRVGGFVSYQLPQDLPNGEWYQERGDGYEQCGFYCAKCEWSNGGARTVEE